MVEIWQISCYSCNWRHDSLSKVVLVLAYEPVSLLTQLTFEDVPMATSKNSAGNQPLQSPRELIVMMKHAGPAAAAATEPGGVADILSKAGASMEPLFDDADAAGEADVTATSDPQDGSFFHVTAPDKHLEKICHEMEMSAEVEAAYIKPSGEMPSMVADPEVEVDKDGIALNEMAPTTEEPPAATPNFASRQGYLTPAPVGIDINYAWRYPGGRGGGIHVIDLEWGWRFSHEDLGQNSGGLLAGSNSSNLRANNHGTAVIGEIGGDSNSIGVTGIAPDARVSTVSFSMPTATAIRQAANNLSRGDVMLLEIHRAGPRHNFQGRQDQRGYIAVEWWPDDFAAIRYATNKGIIVVEAAGNGRENFDDAIYDQRPAGFPTSWRNPLNPSNTSSRAVVVGAGAPPPGTHGRDHGPDRSRLGFSNYGRRVDCQGWGREVTTTGYGDLQGGSQNRWYTDTFSGTSSASPIITAAVACVNGALKANGQAMLSPQGAINLFRSTGSPQTDAPGRPRSQRIGRRPDLKQMLNRVIRPKNRYTGVWRGGNDRHYLWVNASWSSFVSKWQQLGQQRLRLTDFEISKRGNSYVYSGVWREGSDPYYLWVNASWSSFVQKWQQLGQQNLRLVDIEIKQIGNAQRYSGVWRGGSDPYYLWVNASWSSFVQKWQQLSGQNMRLVDVEIRRIGGSLRYTGVWRRGYGAHYLWVNASWSSFIQKWQQLAGQNLRLTKIVRTEINGQMRYSGIWRPGNDPYYLWVNASWQSFVDKWQQLSRNGLRLVDFEVSLDGDAQPSAPGTSGMEVLSMMLETQKDGDGFGGGDTNGATKEGDAPGADPTFGEGGGDFGEGFEVASMQETIDTPDGALTDDADGYGGGILPGEDDADRPSAEADPAFGLSAGESQDGSGYGGGGGVEDESNSDEYAASDDGQGFGGGSVS